MPHSWFISTPTLSHWNIWKCSYLLAWNGGDPNWSRFSIMCDVHDCHICTGSGQDAKFTVWSTVHKLKNSHSYCILLAMHHWSKKIGLNTKWSTLSDPITNVLHFITDICLRRYHPFSKNLHFNTSTLRNENIPSSQIEHSLYGPRKIEKWHCTKKFSEVGSRFLTKTFLLISVRVSTIEYVQMLTLQNWSVHVRTCTCGLHVHLHVQNACTCSWKGQSDYQPQRGKSLRW